MLRLIAVIPAPERVRQEDCEFEASLDWIIQQDCQRETSTLVEDGMSADTVLSARPFRTLTLFFLQPPGGDKPVLREAVPATGAGDPAAHPGSQVFTLP